MVYPMLRPRLRVLDRSPRGTPALGSAHDGQALVELALVVAMLLLTSVGVLEFGRAFHAVLTVTHAARDGARMGTDASVTEAKIISAVDAAASPLDPSGVAVSRSSSEVTVTVSYQFESPVPLISEFWGGGPLTISRSATAHVEPA
ncbi:MAG: hypothetical protein QOF01_5402 [Thermomicrobiales bacterium]|jgi:Flp pilus assembly protein TadG|nr:hypothetical protein [Thermomicrobiales bacterium]MEA2598933.1 hypothetical protein [Thermomicrobiales bacterium]